MDSDWWRNGNLLPKSPDWILIVFMPMVISHVYSSYHARISEQRDTVL